MSYVLQVKNLTKVFNGKRRLFSLTPKGRPLTAVSNISFNLEEGEILGILGPNGAGKTTLIEMLLGTMKPTCGQISYFGQNFYKHAAHCLKFITHASAYNRLPSYLTLAESLEIYGGLYEMPRGLMKERIDQLLTQFKMQKYSAKPAGALSAGQMTRVMLIKAFLPQPKILLLDEPTASLDPDISLEVRSFILKQQKESKVSVILTSHNMQEVAEVCNRALVLQNGILIEEDTPEMLARSVSLSSLSLQITHNMETALRFLKSTQWPHTVLEGKVKVEMEESSISSFLSLLAEHNVQYSHIDIAKPTLEDYFLHLTQGQNDER